MLVPSVGEIRLYLGQQTTDPDCNIIWGSIGKDVVAKLSSSSLTWLYKI